VLSIHDVSYQYPKGRKIIFPDFSLTQGETALLLGESGSGKTTLLHILCGLRAPSHGVVQYDNTQLYQLSSTKRDAFRGKNFGLVFQTPAFINSLTVLENLMTPLFLNHQKQDQYKAKYLLEKVGLFHKINQKPYELSIGEQQRVSIVRSVIQSPKFIFADEPTSALDDKNARQVMDLLLDISQENKASLLVVTHDHRWSPVISKSIQL
jgi:putative ABC transport system ATP-binding protein